MKIAKKILSIFNIPPSAPKVKKKKRKSNGVFSTDFLSGQGNITLVQRLTNATFQKTPDNFVNVSAEGVAMDSAPELVEGTKAQFQLNQSTLPLAQFAWYASQGFIGYQNCAMIAQHWLVSKACTMPSEDATRNGFELSINTGGKVPPEILDAIRAADVKYNLMKNLLDFVRMGRIFGIRVAMFKVRSNDPQYYEKPFNIEGVTPGSYLGISQIDPYWITPELDAPSVLDPSSIHFYEPTWWRINGIRVHRTHLVIFRTEEVADILKPTYLYGGVSIPQKIYERVYAAERTANEAPQLAMTKRSDVIYVDTSQAIAKQSSFAKRLQKWIFFRDNYGVKVLGLEEKMERFDTSLTDLDAVIMSQYQIVAAAACVPAVKLLGTTPKGFNATGEYEQKSYHEMLQSTQTHYLTPLIVRHHMLLMHSEIAPQFGVTPFDTTPTWNPCDSPTAKEVAEVNKLKAETGSLAVQSGAIDGQDERDRLIADPDSGYNGIPEEAPPPPEPEEPSALQSDPNNAQELTAQ